jgi:hypothetical protein
MSVAVIDNATGDLISIQETVHGPHPLRDGVDICGPSVAYLTSPGLPEGSDPEGSDPSFGYPSAARSTASVSPQSGRMNGVPCTVHAIPYQTSSVPDQRRILIVYVSPRTAANSAIS